MRKHLALFAGLGLVAAAAWRLRQDQAAADQADEADGSTWSQLVGDAMSGAVGALGLWRAPAQYVSAIRASEAANGIPSGMLERLLYQESRYREDIISGRVKSPAGAIGIAQFMPATAPQWSVNLYDGSPWDDIAGAGRYLAWLRSRTASWSEALAAYNWGIGNVQRKTLALAPPETRRYFSQILADVNAAAGTAFV